MLILMIFVRNYYENLIPASPTDHMELKEGSNEDEDFDDQEEDQVIWNQVTENKLITKKNETGRGPGKDI